MPTKSSQLCLAKRCFARQSLPHAEPLRSRGTSPRHPLAHGKSDDLPRDLGGGSGGRWSPCGRWIVFDGELDCTGCYRAVRPKPLGVLHDLARHPASCGHCKSLCPASRGSATQRTIHLARNEARDSVFASEFPRRWNFDAAGYTCPLVRLFRSNLDHLLRPRFTFDPPFCTHFAPSLRLGVHLRRAAFFLSHNEFNVGRILPTNQRKRSALIRSVAATLPSTVSNGRHLRPLPPRLRRLHLAAKEGRFRICGRRMNRCSTSINSTRRSMKKVGSAS